MVVLKGKATLLGQLRVTSYYGSPLTWRTTGLPWTRVEVTWDAWE